MDEDFIDIEWWRDTPKRFAFSADHKRICWSGSEPLLRYRPFRDPKFKKGIVDEFAEIKSAEQALKFVQRYGFLTIQCKGKFLELASDEEVMQSHREGEEVEKILALALGLRVFLGKAANRSGELYEQIKTRGSGPQMTVEVWLDPDDASKTVRLRYSVWSLYKAIALVALRSVSGQTSVRLCQNCGKPFRVGRLAKRPQKSIFCSLECKAERHSLKRSERK